MSCAADHLNLFCSSTIKTSATQKLLHKILTLHHHIINHIIFIRIWHHQYAHQHGNRSKYL